MQEEKLFEPICLLCSVAERAIYRMQKWAAVESEQSRDGVTKGEGTRSKSAVILSGSLSGEARWPTGGVYRKLFYVGHSCICILPAR